jgi:phosphoribosylglycinamide formyltransferase-1
LAKLKVGVLISGRGSNLQALIDACAADSIPAEIALVISNVADAAGLERAEAKDVATTVIDHKAYDDRETFDGAMHEALIAAGVQLVCLAGFMRLLTDGFVSRWRDRLINIHPSLLPAFRGLNVHDRVLEYGVRFSGCTVHFVRAAMDDGPIIAQAVVPVLPNDDAESLAARILSHEHRIYPLAVAMIAQSRVRVTGDKVTITGARAPMGAMINPAPE